MSRRSHLNVPLDELNKAVDEAIAKIEEIRERYSPTVREGADAMQAAMDRSRADSERRRGPKPGTGGRPRKGDEKREKRGISLDPAVVRWLEQERQDDETFSEALERILRRQMPESKN